MTLQEMTTLKEMGLSISEIIQLERTEVKKPDSKPEENKPELGNPEIKPESKPEENKPESGNPEIKPESKPDAKDQKISDLQKQINELKQTIQANNRNNASLPNLPDNDLEKRTDEAMAELIRPSIKKGDK